MIKLKAFLIHFSLSGTIIFCFLSLVYFVWYPYPLLDIEGTWLVIAVLVGVDLGLGPVLTMVVYKPGKKGLYGDLALIAVLQISALAYGATTIFIERPLYIVFNVDRFSVITAGLIDIDALRDKTLKLGPFDSPKYVYVMNPTDPVEAHQLMLEVMAGGKDWARRPKMYRPYEQHVKAISKRQKINQAMLLKVYPGVRGRLETIAAKHDLNINDLGFFPLAGYQRHMMMVIDKNTANRLDVLPVDPWAISTR